MEIACTAMDPDAEKGKEKCKELSTGDGRKRKEKRLQLKTGDWKRRKILRIPRMSREPDEVLRLSRRTLPKIPRLSYSQCRVCLSKKHFTTECPCLEKIPEGQTLGPWYDYACLTCGKLDVRPCCGNGYYATDKLCGGCGQPGHWFWEGRCYTGHIFSPMIGKPPGAVWEEIPFPSKKECGKIDGPGYWRLKPKGSSNQSNKLKNIGSKLVSGVKKLVL